MFIVLVCWPVDNKVELAEAYTQLACRTNGAEENWISHFVPPQDHGIADRMLETHKHKG